MLTPPEERIVSASPQHRPKGPPVPQTRILRTHTLFFSATPSTFKHLKNSVFYVFGSPCAQMVCINKREEGGRPRRARKNIPVCTPGWPSRSSSGWGTCNFFSPSSVSSTFPSTLCSKSIPRTPWVPSPPPGLCSPHSYLRALRLSWAPCLPPSASAHPHLCPLLFTLRIST